MRVLYVTQYLARNDEPGANRQWDLLQALARRGHAIDVIISGQHYLEGAAARPKPAREAWEGGTLFRVAGIPGYRRSLRRRVANYVVFALRATAIALRRGGYELVLASTPSPFVGVVGYVASRRCRARLWIEVRDVWPEAAVETGLLRSPALVRACRALNAFLYRRAERIVAITPGIRRHLVAQYGLDEASVEVIPNGWARDVFEHPGPRPDFALLGLDDERFKVMYTGAFGVGNNDIPTILEAARLLRSEQGIVFVFVGDGERRGEIEDFKVRHDLTNILLVGVYPKNVIPHFLETADACVLTLPPGKFFELYLQNKIFDYLGSRRPVIAAVAGDQADLLRACKAGIVVPPGDATALACAVLQLRSSATIRSAMGQSAGDYVAQHYDRSRLVGRYVHALEATAARPGSSLSEPAARRSAVHEDQLAARRHPACLEVHEVDAP